MRNKVIVGLLKQVVQTLNAVIEELDQDSKPYDVLQDSEFQFLIPYYREMKTDYDQKYYEQFKKIGFTGTTIWRIKNLIMPYIKANGALCCPIPTDPSIGIWNPWSFNDNCVADLTNFLLHNTKINGRYQRICNKLLRSPMLYQNFKVTKEEASDEDFDISEHPALARQALLTLWKDLKKVKN